MSEKYLSISEASKRLGVHTGTLRRWANEGKINSVRTPGGRRRFSEDEILRLLGKPSLAEVGKKVRAVIYARVSTLKQADAGNLERQLSRLASYCLEKGYAIVDSFSDIASGLNENRRGLNKFFSLVKEKKVDCVVVEYQDRLARFGYEYIQRYCLDNRVAIEILEEGVVHASHTNQQENKGFDTLRTQPKDFNQELVDDLIAIVSSFSARIYGRRGGRVAKKVSAVLEEEKCIE